MWNWFSAKVARQHWPLDRKLCALSPHDFWHLSDAVTGTLILGSTGSGKSSGAFRHLLLAMLRANLGGLFLCVKPTDRADLERYARLCGRQQDLVIFGSDQPHRFNLLDFELHHGGGHPVSRLENVVQLFRILLELVERDHRSSGSSGDNKYFERASLQLLRNTLLVLILAQEPITLENIYRCLMSAPHSLEQAHDPRWRETSYCYTTLCQADDQPMSARIQKDFELALR